MKSAGMLRGTNKFSAVVGAVCMCTAGAIPAQANTGPDSKKAFKVVNVANNDVLNIRSGPSSDHGVVGELQPGSGGITMTGGCKAMWCPIQHETKSGWVNRKYLAVVASLSPVPPRSAMPEIAKSEPPRVSIAPTPAPTPQPAQPTAKPAAPKTAPEIAFAYFVEKGWTEHQAAGIVGNLQAECGPLLTCSIASGGIAQWRAERVTRFRTVFGHPFHKATFKDQLDYIQWELMHPNSPWKDSGRILKGAKDAASAASLFDIHYERSAGTTRGARMANARVILKKYGGQTPVLVGQTDPQK